METTAEDLATTPLIVTEIDHLVSRGGEDAAAAFYEDLTGGAYLVEWWPEAVSETVEAAGKNPGLGLADASLLALAARLETTRIATLDELHFRGPAPYRGGCVYAAACRRVGLIRFLFGDPGHHESSSREPGVHRPGALSKNRLQTRRGYLPRRLDPGPGQVHVQRPGFRLHLPFLEGGLHRRRLWLELTSPGANARTVGPDPERQAP